MGNYISSTVGGSSDDIMRIRLSHENKACDLTMTGSDTLGGLKKTANELFKIAYNRIRLVNNGIVLVDHPDTTTLSTAGIEDNSVVHAEVLPPVVVKKKIGTPEETLSDCENEANEIKGKLDALLQGVIDSMNSEAAAAPGDEQQLNGALNECKLCDELLTRLMLRLDNIEVDSELRIRRKALLKQIQGLQDGDCNVVKEAIQSRASAAGEQ